MVENGFKRREISEVLGKSISEISNYIKVLGFKSPLRNKEKNGEYFCPNCREYKSKCKFYKCKGNAYDISSWCVECTKKRQYLKYHNKALEEIQKKEKENIKTKEEVNGNLYRVCSTCKETKDVEEFNWKKTNVKLSAQCRTCSKESKRKSLLKRAEEKGY